LFFQNESERLSVAQLYKSAGGRWLILRQVPSKKRSVLEALLKIVEMEKKVGRNTKKGSTVAAAGKTASFHLFLPSPGCVSFGLF